MTKRIVGSIVITLVVSSLAWAQAMRNVPRISIDEVKELMAKNQVVLVDVRDAQSFAAGHMPGALNIVFDDIPNHVDALKKDKRVIVTYCAWVNEATSARAALDMNAFGLTNVKTLLGGWNEWVKKGEKIEK